MKCNLAILLSVFLPLCGFAQVKHFYGDNWGEKDTLYGKVKAIYITDSLRSFNPCGGPPTHFFNKQTKRYNKDGKVTEVATDLGFESNVRKLTYNGDGKITCDKTITKSRASKTATSMDSITYAYDDNRNMVKKFEISIAPGSQPFGGIKTINLYDKGNKVIMSKAYEYGDTAYDQIYYRDTLEYDERGNLTRKVDINNIEIRRYDEQNHIIEEKFLSTDSIVRMHSEFKYDNAGNLIEERMPLSGTVDQPPTLGIYAYNKDNKVIVKHHRPLNSQDTADWQTETFEYDSSGQLVKQTMLRMDVSENSDTGRTITTFEYDDSNRFKKESIYYRGFWGHNFSEEYTWKYDKTGNWIEQIRYRDQELCEILKRKIEYYQ